MISVIIRARKLIKLIYLSKSYLLFHFLCDLKLINLISRLFHGKEKTPSELKVPKPESLTVAWLGGTANKDPEPWHR